MPPPTTHQQSPLLHLARATALLLSSSLTGASITLSTLLVPRLLESPTPLMLQQMARTITHGQSAMPPLTALAAAAYFYLAASQFHVHDHGLRSGGAVRGYLLAGALCAGIAPYTWFLMAPTSRRLLKKAEDVRGMSASEEVVEIGPREEGGKYLVDWWGVLNLGRAALFGLASGVGIFVSL
ncbi:hypothetical protein B0T22DRAFT_60396 [Podospora appendiculata]|uniref:DUF1772-domain-containing protein n=1 Tax=Podospora appendiculata TaxID=314037 RepID=A0AAE0XIT9_9PEZI|nr:hypothetical protein B0T22DRAFT_60396 [Podospora appendiculata]